MREKIIKTGDELNLAWRLLTFHSPLQYIVLKKVLGVLFLVLAVKRSQNYVGVIIIMINSINYITKKGLNKI